MPENNAITIKGLTKKFGSFTAVDNISFNVGKGEIFGFLGPNGAGKSTTIKMLCGLLRPTQCDGRVAGFDIMTQPEQIKRNIGYMSQKFSLYRDLSAEENLDFYAGVYEVPLRDMRKRKEELLELAGLKEKRKEKTSLLTGGWRQRLALACALLHNPPVIFLDEPTSGVDPISRRDFWNIIQYLGANGITVLVTTHYMEEAEYCEKLVLISAGKMIASGSPAELRNSFSGSIYYIETDNIKKTLDILENNEKVSDMSLWGNGIHAVSNEPDMEKEIQATLTCAEITPVIIRKERVALEDIFVNLVMKGS